MKTLLLLTLCVLSLGGIATNAHAHDPRINFSIQFGYPAYFEPPAVYYAPPPVYYEPAPVYYVPRIERRVIVVPYEDYPRHYRYDYGRHRGWYKHKHHYDDDD